MDYGSFIGSCLIGLFSFRWGPNAEFGFRLLSGGFV
jgi:hypothetical protein